MALASRFSVLFTGLTANLKPEKPDAKGKAGGRKAVYWIYNFKQGTYYPFIPLSGKQRDSPFEFRLRAEMEREMPVEKNVEKWYPLWGIPF